MDSERRLYIFKWRVDDTGSGESGESGSGESGESGDPWLF